MFLSPASAGERSATTEASEAATTAGGVQRSSLREILGVAQSSHMPFRRPMSQVIVRPELPGPESQDSSEVEKNLARSEGFEPPTF